VKAWIGAVALLFSSYLFALACGDGTGAGGDASAVRVLCGVMAMVTGVAGGIAVMIAVIATFEP
jgi:hypothetical protein